MKEKTGVKKTRDPITKCAPNSSRSIPDYFFLNMNDYDVKSALSTLLAP